METFTVQAVYKKGVLKPKTKFLYRTNVIARAAFFRSKQSLVLFFCKNLSETEDCFAKNARNDTSIRGCTVAKTKLNLPEDSLVELQIKTTEGEHPSTFGSLLGIWSHLSDAEVSDLEKNLARIRRASGRKVKNIGKNKVKHLNLWKEGT